MSRIHSNAIERFACLAIIAGFLGGAASAASATDRQLGDPDPLQTLLHDGIERHYLVRMPAEAVLRAGAVPLVLVLHGGGGNAENAERMTGFSDKARREGFIVVYPEGTSRFRQKLLTWNAGHCCGYAMEHKVDDVGFIRALIGQLVKEYPVDPKRIYVTGMSNGGMMTHRLGRELSDQLAAIAPVVATLFGDESKAAYPVSALMLNGMLDKSVPYLGGPPGGRFNDAWDGTPAQPALAQGAYWAGSNNCAGEPVRLDHGTYINWRYSCPVGKAVELYLLKDNGHAWPGGQKGSRRGDAPSASLNATDLIWDFFAAQDGSR
ncbi:MAG: polyhydroxybutyrate depolymerase [Gammaproteobacteria bacterium]|nr:polyhydroxybutyrate depolymerase [Gammaproteobacteria bacterium]